MAVIGEAQLKEELKNERYAKAYLLFGEESYLKETYVGKLLKKLVVPDFEDFNLHRHEGKDTNIDSILMDASMLPMMSEYSVVLVHDYTFDKSGDADKLKAYFEEPNDNAVLIFWCDSVDVDTKKSAKWKKLVDLFSKKGCAVNLEKRSEAELVKLVMSSAKKLGCTIDRVNASYFISVVGSDIQTVFNELKKICAFVHEGEITRDIIDNLATKSLQARVFNLSKFILAGRSNEAFEALRALFAQKEEPLGILSVISSCYIDMYRVKCAKHADKQESDLCNYFRYKGREFVLRNAARDCNKLSTNALRQAIDLLADADEKMKSTGIDKNLLLEETVAKLLLLRNK